MLVEAQVSSMKTRRSGSRSSWASNQSSRRLEASRCGPARLHAPTFFERDPVSAEEAPEPGDTGRNLLLCQSGFDLGERNVPVRRHDRHDRVGLAFHRLRATVAAQRQRMRRALVALAHAPSADAGCAHPKAIRRLTMAGAAATACRTRTRRSTERAFDMPAGLRPADSLNQLRTPLGIPNDSISSKCALDVLGFVDGGQSRARILSLSTKRCAGVCQDTGVNPEERR